VKKLIVLLLLFIGLATPSYAVQNSLERNEKSAAQGNIQAAFELGDSYYFGKDVKQDYHKVFEWYQKSAASE
jgi:TPR repeat protein